MKHGKSDESTQKCCNEKYAAGGKKERTNDLKDGIGMSVAGKMISGYGKIAK